MSTSAPSDEHERAAAGEQARTRRGRARRPRRRTAAHERRTASDREERHEPLRRAGDEVEHVADPRRADRAVHVPAVEAEVDDEAASSRSENAPPPTQRRSAAWSAASDEREERRARAASLARPRARSAAGQDVRRSAPSAVTTSTSSRRVTSTAGTTRASWKRPCRLLLELRHLADRQAAREDAVGAGRDEQVALDHVLGAERVVEPARVGLAEAAHVRARARALDAHRDRAVPIGEDEHVGGARR